MENFGYSNRKYQRLLEKAESILSDFHTGHSMGCYRKMYIKYKYKWHFFADNNILNRYAPSCTWRPTWGSVMISLTKKEIEQIQNIEGIWTIVNNDGTAKWLYSKSSKYYYKVIWENGFVYKQSHSTESLAHARALQIKKDNEQLKIKGTFVGYDHIRKLGACEQGIKAFCERHNLNMDYGYSVEYLKSINDPFSGRYLNKLKIF